jgi:hypothetical protein
MLNFEQKKDNKIERKAFYELDCGFFVWDDKPDTLCLKITDNCYLNTSDNNVYTVCNEADEEVLEDLDIIHDCYHGMYNVVFDVKIEIEEPIKWSVIR